MIRILAQQIMQMSSPASPMPDNENRRLFEPKFSDLIPEVKIFEYLKWRGDQHDDESQKQFGYFVPFYMAQRKNSKKIGYRTPDYR